MAKTLEVKLDVKNLKQVQLVMDLLVEHKRRLPLELIHALEELKLKGFTDDSKPVNS